jgi:hypothetical protein
VADFGIWHLEVKAYGGAIRGDAHQWVLENGGVHRLARDRLLELLTGRRPYDDVDAVIASRADPPLDRALLLAELGTPGSEDFMESPADAADVVLGMCRLDPAARHANMDEVIEDLAILGES